MCVAEPAAKTEGDLITDRNFQDFDLHVEFLLEAGWNSGVYLRGRYEVQLRDAIEPVPVRTQCGAVVNLIAPAKQAYIGPDKWNTLDVKLVGRSVTVSMNGDTLIESGYLAHPTLTALDDLEDQPGPIMLQCREKTCRFRNVRIRPIE